MAAADVASRSAAESFLLDRDLSNASAISGAVGSSAADSLDYENTWQLMTSIATALILGFIILATVIGEFKIMLVCSYMEKYLLPN